MVFHADQRLDLFLRGVIQPMRIGAAAVGGHGDADELMMIVLDAGAEDFAEEEDSYEVLTAPDDLGAVREALEAAGVPLLEAQVAMIPQTTVELTDEKALKDIQRILDLLDDDDDVTDVWHNWAE